MDKEALKKSAALAALEFIEQGDVIGVGTGSTVHYFIEGLKSVKGKIEAAVASSLETEKKLKALSIPVFDLNSIGELPLYVDGADEVNSARQMIKGGGGALTREKIIAAVAKKFICIADQTKQVDLLGTFPLPIEVIPMARSYVAREIVKLGGDPIYRKGFVTDNGNIILDVFNLKMLEPIRLEETLNNLEGVVANGICAKRPADMVLLGFSEKVERY